MAQTDSNEGTRPAIVLKDTVVRGDMSLPAGLCLYGRVAGNVKSAGRVEVEAGAVVEGGVESRELFVEGRIDGDVRTEVLEVGEGAELKGRVAVARLRMRGRRYELGQVMLTGK